MPRLKALLVLLSAACLLAVSVLGLDIWQQLYRPLPYQQTVTFELPRGASVRQIARQLQQAGVLHRPLYFEAYIRLFQLDSRLQAGEYVLSPGLSADQVLDKILTGDVLQHSFTIIEGWTFKQLRAALATEPLFKHTLPVDADYKQVMELLGYAGQHPEGRFYPDTYFFSRNTTDVAFLQRAYRQMAQVLERQWQQRSEGLPIKTPYEALILASIVERESALASERPLVAAVFVNRLNKRMRLQTDPTVIYGMGDEFDGDIRFRDLRRDTPYNTYTRHGLTPTPIAMPSEAAIHASLHPADSPVLYFVAKGEPDGSHHFSTNLAEHNAAVDRYQRRRRKRN